MSRLIRGIDQQAANEKVIFQVPDTEAPFTGFDGIEMQLRHGCEMVHEDMAVTRCDAVKQRCDLMHQVSAVIRCGEYRPVCICVCVSACVMEIIHNKHIYLYVDE